MSGEPHPIRYRPDIDGLRAIAVAAVVLFHAELVPFPGGFMGVDVFFVISGYLITGILLQDASILRFYQRRARRILPALFVLLATVLVGGAFAMLPHDYESVARTTGATLLFSSNILFWRMSDYFAHETQLWPLLHTWSLGVEEQFYILFPLVLRFLPLRGRALLALLIGTALASLALAIVFVARNNDTIAFYLVPFRAWELLVGSILATGMLPPPRRAIVRSVAAVAGIVAVVLPMATSLVPLPFPGLGAIPAVLGAAVLIWTGSGGRHLVSPLLSAKPVLFVGLISYSLYLWHWPVLAFARYVAVDPLGPAQALAAVAAAFGLATLSWRFVERPFRRHSVPDRTIWLRSGGGIAVLLGICGLILGLHGLPGRFRADLVRLNASSGDTWRCPLPHYIRCGGVLACPVALPPGRAADADVILWGDSHAQMYVPALRAALGDRTGLLVNAYGCAPVMGDAASPACGTAQRANFRAIAASRARIVMLAQNWPQYRDEAGARLGRDPLPSERYGDAIRRLRQVVAGLRHAGKDVVIIGPISVPGYDVGNDGSRELLFHGRITSPTYVARADDLREYANVRSAIAALAMQPHVRALWVDSRGCDARRCGFIHDGRAIFADHGHFRTDYATSLAPVFRNALRAVDEAGTHPLR